MVPDTARRSPIRWLRLLASGLLAATLGACSTAGYLLQAANGEARLLARRRPLGQVIADPATPPGLRTQLETVRAARDFAVHELALPDNASYRSYADIGRPYVVWNVIAAAEFSVEPRRWCFPFTGCVAYRGYFREANARRYAARLAGRGDDVLVAGVSAYSTLGHFNDPVLSSMLRQGENTLVATLFHELAHQLLYVPGDTGFSEAFAMTVEQAGLERWLVARGRASELDAFLAQRGRQAAHAGVFARAREDLAALYAGGLPVAAMRERKRERLQQAGEEIRSLVRTTGSPSGYEPWIDAGLNNAHLAAVSSYQGCIPAFQRLLEEAGGELPRFYAAARALASGPAAARRALCAPGPAAGAGAITSPRPGPASAPPPAASGS